MLSVAIVIQWLTLALTYFVPPLALVAWLALPLVLAFGAWLLYQRRWGAVALLSVTSPITFIAASATVDYARGSAQVRTISKPLIEPERDDATGLPLVSTGCVVHGTEWIQNGVHNGTLRGLTAVFGRARNAAGKN